MNLVNFCLDCTPGPVAPQSLIHGHSGAEFKPLTMARCVQDAIKAISVDKKGGQLLSTHLVMTDLYVAVRSDCPGVLKVAASDNGYCSCPALQAGHCFTVRPLAIFCDAGDCVSLVHAELESRRLAGDWFAVSLREVCDAVSRVLADEVARAH